MIRYSYDDICGLIFMTFHDILGSNWGLISFMIQGMLKTPTLNNSCLIIYEGRHLCMIC